LDSTDIIEQNTENEIVEKQSAVKSPIETDPNNNAKRNKILISGSIGYNLARSNYIGSFTSESKFYNLNHTENNTVEYNLSADVILKKHLTLGSGLALTKQSYNYSYYNTETESLIDSCLCLIESTDSISNDTIFTMVYDTTSIQTLTSVQGISKAEYLRIPFSVGYIHSYKRFMFGIKANANLNILLNTSGSYFNNFNAKDFTKENNPIFKKSYFDLNFKTDLYYRIAPNFFALGTFSYRPKFGNVYKDIIVQRKLQYFHFGLGLTYRL
jgi:hypothetical protein